MGTKVTNLLTRLMTKMHRVDKNFNNASISSIRGSGFTVQPVTSHMACCIVCLVHLTIVLVWESVGGSQLCLLGQTSLACYDKSDSVSSVRCVCVGSMSFHEKGR